jgi:ABC-type lipoprotein release transport system permease subunit
VPLGLIAGRPFVQAIGSVIEFPSQYSLALKGLWIWLAIVVVLSLVASWLPARRATQISVSESLAYE